MTPDDMNIRQMTRDELDIVVDWAAREGWNPGLDDADVFWATDPEGFVAAEIGGELIGGGSIVAYGKKYASWGSSSCVRNTADVDWAITYGMSASGACWRALTPTRRSAWTACLTCSTTMPAADSGLLAVTFASRDWAWTFHNQRASLRPTLFPSSVSMLMIGDTSPRRAADSCKIGFSGREDMPSP